MTAFPITEVLFSSQTSNLARFTILILKDSIETNPTSDFCVSPFCVCLLCVFFLVCFFLINCIQDVLMNLLTTKWLQHNKSRTIKITLYQPFRNDFNNHYNIHFWWTFFFPSQGICQWYYVRQGHSSWSKSLCISFIFQS